MIQTSDRRYVAERIAHFTVFLVQHKERYGGERHATCDVRIKKALKELCTDDAVLQEAINILAAKFPGELAIYTDILRGL